MGRLASFLAYFIWLWRWLKSHKRIRIVVITILCLELLGGLLLGPDVFYVTLTVLQVIFQFAFAISFMLIQFVALFWFLSQSKVILVRPGDPKTTTFADYAGQKPLVEMMQQWLFLLKDRGKFQKMGGAPVSGILLTGPPGTGKTYLAKCMAGEGGVAFFGMDGSSFRAMFWGVDVLKVIQFFSRARALAREYGSCIAYLDEIDAIGMSRGGVQGGQTQMAGMMGGMMGSGALNRLLYEMDGLGDQREMDVCVNIARRWLGMPPLDVGYVLVMGATNRPDVLDPALKRPGRFDRIIQVDRPDKGGRREIIKYYLSKIAHDDDIDIEALVADTAWATPASIMSAMTKDAVRLAVFDDREKVSQEDVELAMMEQAMGLQNPISDLDPLQEQQIAIHEAGHAIAQYHLRKDERIVHLTITRRSSALGFMMPVPETDIYTLPMTTLVKDVMISLAGHVATKLVLGGYWTGASGDLAAVRSRVAFLASHGMFGSFPIESTLGGGTFGGQQEKIDKFLHDCLEKVNELLQAHRAELDALVDALLERKSLSGKDVIAVIKGATGGENE